MAKIVEVNNVMIGKGKPLVIIAGPCVIESRGKTLKNAKALKKISENTGISMIFKASYDKANRSSVDSFRGPGIDEGLDILRQVKEEISLPVLSDIHSSEEAEKAKNILDVLQIPAFLCRQTDLLLSAGKTGKAVNVKKGQFMSPEEMENAAGKIESTGNKNILLTERGTTFGYNNLVNDFRSIVIMRETGYPVVYDATHSVQRPGGKGKTSGGDPQFILPLARAAVACGVDAVFLEVHEEPADALSDGANMLKISELEEFLNNILKIDRPE